ncbi:MAG: recombinase family protein [Planctomycetaceae bacterium]|nr:recombinase family protein [Planctomycetaceae bacterium]
MNSSDLVQPHHLKRRAVIYVRQSTPHQVANHQESLRLQYAMQTRAMDLGWHESNIEVIDADLGMTASDINSREGFQHLAARIALNEIGVVVAYDATRLARNCTHWYQLLDLCGGADCLITDRDGVYDAGNVNGRLLLGLKGQISEMELHTLKARLAAGLLNKAQRGELALLLPCGLERLATDEVVKCTDVSVQRVVSLVFKTVMRTRSATGTARFFVQEEIRLPIRDRFGDIQWRRATPEAVLRTVKNPAYAGAFVYGRTKTTRLESGKKEIKQLPIEQWRVCVKDVYPAYVSWDSYLQIQEMLSDNSYRKSGARGAPQDGKALLQGIVYCGCCGHTIGSRERGELVYWCRALATNHGEPLCQNISSDTIDKHVLGQFFLALSAAEIDLSVASLDEVDGRRRQLVVAREDEVARCEHREQLARRQFNLADPENRLVASELERHWELALQEAEAARQRLEEQLRTLTWSIPPDTRDALKDIGSALPSLWEQGMLTTVQMKSLVRTLIEKVVLKRVDEATVHVRIVWRSGETTSSNVLCLKKYGRLDDMPNASSMKSRIVEMAREGKNDQEIAKQLTEQGYRGPQTPTVTIALVQRIRLANGIRQRSCAPHREGFWTVSELARELNMKRQWIYNQIAAGRLTPTKTPEFTIHLFPKCLETLDLVKQLAVDKTSGPTLTKGNSRQAPSNERRTS